MNSTYYDELYKEIEKSFREEDIKKGLDLIEKELAMPYIPKDFEDKILALKEKYSIKDYKSFNLDEEKIEEYLMSGDEFKELLAADYLNGLSLRKYHDLIQNFLLSNGSNTTKSLLIESLIEQGISIEYKVLKDGIEYSFIPKYLETIEESDGYIEVSKFIKENIEVDNPSIAAMARKLFAKVCFDALPMSLSLEESIIYIKSIIIYIYELFNDEEAKNDFINKYLKEDEIILSSSYLDEVLN